MRRIFRCLCALSAFLACTTAARAQSFSDAESSEVVLALTRGRMLYQFDQAAWHATDKLMEDAKAAGKLDIIHSQLSGWVVQPADSAMLDVVFYDRTSPVPKRLYTARMADGGKRVVSGNFAGPDAVITDALTLSLIKARAAAQKALQGQSILRCKKENFNFAVLPPEQPGGAISVYLLTPQSDMASVPFGGHLRIMVSPNGTVGPAHPFTKSCLELPTKLAKDAPTGLIATQLLDPLPTEVDVFTMFVAGIPLYILTPDNRIWAIEASGGYARARLLSNDKKQR